MGIRQLLARDAAVLTKAAHFGETVGYRPAAGGGPYTIAALVVRDEPGQRPETNRHKFCRVLVRVRNDADPTVGVASPVKDRDTVDVVFRVGDAAATGRVTEVRYGDEGSWLLEVTK